MGKTISQCISPLLLGFLFVLIVLSSRVNGQCHDLWDNASCEHCDTLCRDKYGYLGGVISTCDYKFWVGDTCICCLA
ncbi:hypothetical protein MKX01_023748 [Papaver californicum]|nr:hypothetical protein MKX01_023748 [Papaver californicum]